MGKSIGPKGQLAALRGIDGRRQLDRYLKLGKTIMIVITPKNFAATAAACVIALAGFATALHATGSSLSESIVLAKLTGKGTIGAACHADEGNNHIYTGKYKEVFGKVHCGGPTGESINCTNEKAICADGQTQP
jgi:hypothetical protein